MFAFLFHNSFHRQKQIQISYLLLDLIQLVGNFDLGQKIHFIHNVSKKSSDSRRQNSNFKLHFVVLFCFVQNCINSSVRSNVFVDLI